MDIALYDIMGKAVDKPVYQLLGGRHRRAIPVAHSLGVVMDVDAAVEEAVLACQEGIRSIKMKGGLDLKRDLLLMKKLREALGPDVHILVDAKPGLPLGQRGHQMGQPYEPVRPAVSGAAGGGTDAAAAGHPGAGLPRLRR